MHAIVTAGGVPEKDDPLYKYSMGKEKALLEIAGKPMIQWVLDALCQAKRVDHVVVVGLADSGGITCRAGIEYLPSHGGMVANLRAGVDSILKREPGAEFVLGVSSDIPGITSEMVDWTVTQARDAQVDACYNVIPRTVMEARYPISKRTYLRLRDVEVCGADMNVFRTRLIAQNPEFWERLVSSRKNVLRQAALIGFDTLILVMLRLITLEQAVKMVTRRLKISGKAVLSPYAEIGMDIDKPHQFEILQADLSRIAGDARVEGP